MDKYNIINTLASAVLTDVLKNNKIVFITSLGIVYGNIYTPSKVNNDESMTKENSLDWLCKVISDKDIEDTSKNIKIQDDSLLLKDVELEYPNGDIKSLPYLFLFTDQIIGILLGNAQKRKKVAF